MVGRTVTSIHPSAEPPHGGAWRLRHEAVAHGYRLGVADQQQEADRRFLELLVDCALNALGIVGSAERAANRFDGQQSARHAGPDLVRHKRHERAFKSLRRDEQELDRRLDVQVESEAAGLRPGECGPIQLNRADPSRRLDAGKQP